MTTNLLPIAARLAPLVAVALLGTTGDTVASPEEDRRIIAALDTEYQAAVKRNDAGAMGRILDERFVLVLGDGKTYTRADLLDSATSGKITYEQQDEDQGTQTVRVFGDTAVVTARLWLKGGERRCAIRPPALVQRHLCAHAGRLALCFRTSFARAANRILTVRRASLDRTMHRISSVRRVQCGPSLTRFSRRAAEMVAAVDDDEFTGDQLRAFQQPHDDASHIVWRTHLLQRRAAIWRAFAAS